MKTIHTLQTVAVHLPCMHIRAGSSTVYVTTSLQTEKISNSPNNQKLSQYEYKSGKDKDFQFEQHIYGTTNVFSHHLVVLVWFVFLWGVIGLVGMDGLRWDFRLFEDLFDRRNLWSVNKGVFYMGFRFGGFGSSDKKSIHCDGISAYRQQRIWENETILGITECKWALRSNVASFILEKYFILI